MSATNFGSVVSRRSSNSSLASRGTATSATAASMPPAANVGAEAINEAVGVVPGSADAGSVDASSISDATPHGHGDRTAPQSQSLAAGGGTGGAVGSSAPLTLDGAQCQALLKELMEITDSADDDESKSDYLLGEVVPAGARGVSGRKPGKGSDGVVRRPMNAFMIFSTKFRKPLRNRFPAQDNKSISRLLGDLWSSMPRDTKAHFQGIAGRLQAAHKAANPGWNYNQNSRRVLESKELSTMLAAQGSVPAVPLVPQPSLSGLRNVPMPPAAPQFGGGRLMGMQTPQHMHPHVAMHAGDHGMLPDHAGAGAQYVAGEGMPAGYDLPTGEGGSWAPGMRVRLSNPGFRRDVESPQGVGAVGAAGMEGAMMYGGMHAGLRAPASGQSQPYSMAGMGLRVPADSYASQPQQQVQGMQGGGAHFGTVLPTGSGATGAMRARPPLRSTPYGHMGGASQFNASAGMPDYGAGAMPAAYGRSAYAEGQARRLTNLHGPQAYGVQGGFNAPSPQPGNLSVQSVAAFEAATQRAQAMSQSAVGLQGGEDEHASYGGSMARHVPSVQIPSGVTNAPIAGVQPSTAEMSGLSGQFTYRADMHTAQFYGDYAQQPHQPQYQHQHQQQPQQPQQQHQQQPQQQPGAYGYGWGGQL